ncbi:MAG: periplasmic sensor signal transduction histidine kinase [Acidimicrobiaceae bacterium]|nr:periplasmic sensor signal transduction histidine kinase [Acidimicrobiaceae bacterium]
MRRQVASGLGIGVVGVVAAWGLALGIGDSAGKAFKLVLLAAGTSLAFSLVGVALLRLLRQRSFIVLLWIGVISTIAGVAAGVAIAGKEMFLSTTDARAVMVMLVAAGTVGVVSALLLGSNMGNAVSRVAADAGARMSGTNSSRATPPTRELGDLVHHLDSVFDSMRSAQVRERAVEESRRELIAWISHDLRTPLADIRAMTEAIEDGVVSDAETVVRYHRSILNEVHRLTSMVDDLFRLSQIHAGLLRLDLERVDLSDLVSDALSGATPSALASGVLLSGDVARLDRAVDVSTGEFLRVLRNLLENAIDHTPDGGRVTVAAETTIAEAIIVVRDECGGIPADDLDRVFELGFRGDASRSPAERPHAGLGLAIAKGLVNAHGGSIDVANDGEGCRFTVILPLTGHAGDLVDVAR